MYIHILFTENFPLQVGPCHHSMASHQVADGGTAASMDGSNEYIDVSSRGQATRCSPLAWVLRESLTTPHRKNWPCFKKNTCASGLD